MNIRVNHNSRAPIYMQIAAQMKSLILSGEMVTGCVLPSERSLAHMLGVHRNTVARAYTELKAEELIESRQGYGYVVSLPERKKAAAAPRSRKKKVHWPELIKDEYLDLEVAFDDVFQRFSDERLISLGSGISTSEVYDKHKVAAEIASLIAEGGKNQYFYNPYQGDKRLRHKLVSFLSTKGIKAGMSEIQILTETNQALDFLVALLLRTGDTVIMEEPVSPDAFRAVELAGGKVVTVPVDEDGMQCDCLEELILLHKPRFIYVNSSFHDPTGVILSGERRQRLLEISEAYRIPVVEDDAASELVYSGPKHLPLKASDTQNNVIYIYSFSLTFLPGLSLAVVVADKELIRSLSYLVSVRLVATDWMSQKLIAGYLDDGRYYRNLHVFRSNYAIKQEIMCRELDKMKPLGMEYVRPRGGVYIWCRLPEGVDSMELEVEARRMGVSIVPGYVFYPGKSGGRDYIRLNFSYESRERIRQGLDILRRAIEAQLAQKK